MWKSVMSDICLRMLEICLHCCPPCSVVHRHTGLDHCTDQMSWFAYVLYVYPSQKAD